MRLVANWRAVLTRAWSVRLMALAAFFTALEAALPLLNGYLPIPPLTFAMLSGVCSGLALFARFVAQKSISGGSDA